MSRPMLAKPTALIREVKQRRAIHTHFSQELARGREPKEPGKERRGRVDDSSWWVPHPTTGIYYPKGHEWVMEDVPRGASSFPQTYWLRSFEGVEKPASDPSASEIFDHPLLNV
ncbi:hypothetical protein COCNU_05G002840 [Cocos nucifera]|uniref:Late embryogenesis abundant protein n=1 Tax=Cocos nucifera TaxID=13894 RepID=A0A8K0N193_COCNU|nr:hypothetical protein COCNU_05G002840 [Cocos nucifera]